MQENALVAGAPPQTPLRDLIVLHQMPQLVGRGLAAPYKNHIPALSLLAGLGLRPFTYCCGMIKIGDWQSICSIVVLCAVGLPAINGFFVKYKLYTRN